MDRMALEGREGRDSKALWETESGLSDSLHMGNKMKGIVKDAHLGQLSGGDRHWEVKQKRGELQGLEQGNPSRGPQEAADHSGLGLSKVPWATDDNANHELIK